MLDSYRISLSLYTTEIFHASRRSPILTRFCTVVTVTVPDLYAKPQLTDVYYIFVFTITIIIGFNGENL